MDRKNNLLLIDADDTLWESALFFQRAEQDFLALMGSLGSQVDEVRATVHDRDIERLSVTGYGAEPYIGTLASVMREYCPEPPHWAMTSLDDIRRCLLGHPVVLTPGAVEALSEISRMPFHTVVYTMGEEEHQRDKFRRSSLDSMVHELTIVPEKTVRSLRVEMESRGFTPERTLVVGNSPRSDINPATELGLNAVFLRRELTWTAEHEDFRDPDLVIEIDSFIELIGILRDHLERGASAATERSASGWRYRS